MRARFEDAQAIVLVGGRAFVAYPYRDDEPVPEGVAVLHIADNPEAFGREHAAAMALLGDIGLTLAAAAARLTELTDTASGRGAACGSRRAETSRQGGDCAPTFSPRARACRSRPTRPCWRRSTRCRKTR